MAYKHTTDKITASFYMEKTTIQEVKGTSIN